MGESIVLRGGKRCRELGNACLWCDEFFTKHFDIKTLQPIEKINKNSEHCKAKAHFNDKQIM